MSIQQPPNRMQEPQNNAKGITTEDDNTSVVSSDTSEL